MMKLDFALFGSAFCGGGGGCIADMVPRMTHHSQSKRS
jgi:hypothetical protein